MNGGRICDYNVPKAYPKRYDSEFIKWAVKQPFPFDGILKKTVKDDDFEHHITAMVMSEWKYRDHRVKVGEKALFWLGNRPFWTNRQVQYVDGFAFWTKRESSAYSKGEIQAGGYGTDWEHDAGDGNGGPFF